MRIGGKVLFAHGAAEQRTIGLHPCRRTPWRREEKQVGIDGESGTQSGQDSGPVVFDGEVLQLWIGLWRVVVAVGRARVITGADAGAADGESEAVGRKEFMQKICARLRLHAAEQIAGGIGEGSAEAKNALEFLRGIDGDVGVMLSIC